MKLLIAFVSLCLLCLLAINASEQVCDVSPRINPQYLLANGLDGWDYNNPDSITVEWLAELLYIMGTRGTDTRKLGISFTISYLNVARNNLTVVQESLERILNITQANDMPIMLGLDGFEWWDERADLWNWFDPNITGYNPANVNNVEWTGWNGGTAEAIMISWRNWGSQLRVKPHPNLGSPQFLKAQVEGLQALVPVVVKWYNALPDDKKYLLAGIKAGWELAIGTNYWYYPNGNSLLYKDPRDDPTTSLKGSVQLGYAAVSSLGLAHSGPMTQELLDTVLSNYVRTITYTMHSLGVPHNKIYTHVGNTVGAFYPSAVVGNGPLPAFTPYAHPGWSFYSYAFDPAKAPGMADVIASLELASWATAEWYYIGGNGGTLQQQWQQAVDNSFGFMNNHIINIYNFDSFRTNVDIVAALRAELAEEPCVVEPASNGMSTLNKDGTVTLAWALGQEGAGVYLIVSTSSATTPGGQLVDADVVQAQVDPTTCSYVTHALKSGSYYWNVVTDGCVYDGIALQRMVSEVFTFQV